VRESAAGERVRALGVKTAVSRNGHDLVFFEEAVRSHAEQAHRPARGVGALEERQGASGDFGGAARGRGRGVAARGRL